VGLQRPYNTREFQHATYCHGEPIVGWPTLAIDRLYPYQCCNSECLLVTLGSRPPQRLPGAGLNWKAERKLTNRWRRREEAL